MPTYEELLKQGASPLSNNPTYEELTGAGASDYSQPISPKPEPIKKSLLGFPMGKPATGMNMQENLQSTAEFGRKYTPVGPLADAYSRIIEKSLPIPKIVKPITYQGTQQQFQREQQMQFQKENLTPQPSFKSLAGSILGTGLMIATPAAAKGLGGLFASSGVNTAIRTLPPLVQSLARIGIAGTTGFALGAPQGAFKALEQNASTPEIQKKAIQWGISAGVISGGIQMGSEVIQGLASSLQKLGEKIQISVLKPTRTDIENGFKIENLNKHKLGGSIQDTMEKGQTFLGDKSKELKQVLAESPDEGGFKIYRGEGGILDKNLGTSGGGINVLGPGYYGETTRKGAEIYGPDIIENTVNVQPSEMRIIRSQSEYDTLISKIKDAISNKEIPLQGSEPIQNYIPSYLSKFGYKGIDGTAINSGVNIFDKNLLTQGGGANINLNEVYQQTASQFQRGSETAMRQTGKMLPINRAVSRLQEEINAVVQDPTKVDLVAANTIKQGAGQSGAWAYGIPDEDSSAREVVYNAFYHNMKVAIENAGQTEQIRTINREMQDVIPIVQAATRRLPVAMRNQPIGLLEHISLATSLFNPSALLMLLSQVATKSGNVGARLSSMGVPRSLTPERAGAIGSLLQRLKK